MKLVGLEHFWTLCHIHILVVQLFISNMFPPTPFLFLSFFYSRFKFSPLFDFVLTTEIFYQKILFPFCVSTQDLNTFLFGHLHYYLFPSVLKLFVFNLVFLLRFIKGAPPLPPYRTFNFLSLFLQHITKFYWFMEFYFFPLSLFSSITFCLSK